MIISDNNIIHLSTKNTSYILRLLDGGYIEQLYYGEKVRHVDNYEVLFEKIATGYGCSNVTPSDKNLTLDNICLEYSFAGTGDYRHLPLSLQMPDACFSNDFRYESHNIYQGIYNESNKTQLPYAKENNSEHNREIATLDITLRDSVYPVYLHLIYTVFDDCDVITRRVKIENHATENIVINKIMSMMLDLSCNKYNLHTFDGLWIRERHENIKKLTSGIYVNDSTTGSSSNRHNPFIMLSKDNSTQDFGECYGFNLIYSGNHYEAVEVSEHGKARIMSGINPHQFSWAIKGGEVFYTPEAVISYSSKGQNKLSHNMHKFINNHIIPQQWAYKERPILINNWEATYFDFNAEKLLNIAREAKELGIEMLVLDDGWFGNRSDDTSSLGDWTVNEQKLGGPLGKLAKNINDIGLKFGLWFEPEMISEKSELFKNHPDWAIKAPGRVAYIGRNQFVLDLTRADVREYVVDSVKKVLKSAPIDYVKWDMNRHISDAYSISLGKNQGEFYHRYILGLYDIIDKITGEFPEILFEGCSAGGNRFDLGILNFMPQIWTSDDTDANERISIQQGTSFGYPLSAMTAHVSAVPNHQTLRYTSVETRFNVACFGVLGYEIDITKLSKAEKTAIKEQILFYKKHRSLFQFGSFYRIQADDNSVVWQVVSEDKEQAMMMFYQKLAVPNGQSDIIKATGIIGEALYEFGVRRQYMFIGNMGISENSYNEEPIALPLCESEEYVAYGDMLMNAGIKLSQKFVGIGFAEKTRIMGDFDSRLYKINKR